MGTVSVSPVFWSSSIVVFVGALLVLALALAIYVAATARARARHGMDELEHERDVAVTQLKEAEEIGKVGSFLWDFLEPSRSYWSDEMYELFGLVKRRKMPPIDSLLPYIHEGDRARFENTWQRAMTQPGNFSFTVRTVSNRGQVRNLNIEGRTVIREHETASVRGVAHDVTREMEIDRAKSEFVSLASHQLKTPLTSIKWLSEMLAAENAEPLSEKQLEYVRNIKASARQMFEMVNDLLSMSRIELGTLAMTLTEFDIDALVKDVINEQSHTAGQHSITVNLTSDPSFPKMHADQKLVRMILQNLLSNAIKYSPDGSTVDYSLSLVSTPKDTIYIEVKDRGIGIPEKEQQKVFEKLYRAENAQKLVPDGTGLGLYVIKTILARAGGAITFESKEGQGTTFFVSIPVVWNVGDKPA
jgi:signal transduction histidine kinase